MLDSSITNTVVRVDPYQHFKCPNLAHLSRWAGSAIFPIGTSGAHFPLPSCPVVHRTPDRILNIGPATLERGGAVLIQDGTGLYTKFQIPQNTYPPNLVFCPHSVYMGRTSENAQ